MADNLTHEGTVGLTPNLGMRALLVLVVVSGPRSREADFGRLHPFKSQKIPFSVGIPAPKTPSPDGYGPPKVEEK